MFNKRVSSERSSLEVRQEAFNRIDIGFSARVETVRHQQ